MSAASTPDFGYEELNHIGSQKIHLPYFLNDKKSVIKFSST